MPENNDPSRLERAAAVLLQHGVKFVVIGGQAEYLFGSPRVTYDVDLCYERTAENLDRLARALAELKPALRGAPADLPVLLDARALALGSNYTFDTTIGQLDLLGFVEPIGGYPELAKNARTFRIGGADLLVIDIDDLIRIKEHIGRSKDRESLLQLYAIKRIRQERAHGEEQS
jgi:predicted nucleotidyltransferase